MRRLVGILLSSAGVAGASAPAWAQDAAAVPPSAAAGVQVADDRQPVPPPGTVSTTSDPATPSNAGGDVVVTGSRIVRDGYTAPTPVTVARTDDLLRSTPSSIPDALNKLPQFSNSLSPARSASNFSNFPIQGNILNLRSLGIPSNNPKGPLRTLILFDGIRVPPTTYVGTIDTNVLPELLMQRVDVVTGGASAQWGSDAVAGVVNFILDKNFTGIKGVAQAGVAQRGYNANQRLGLAGGFDFGGGKGHVLLSGDFFNNEGMDRDERAIGRLNAVYVGSNNALCSAAAGAQQRTCTAAPGTQVNPYTIANNVRISAVAGNGRIVGSSVAGNPFVGQVINSDGTTRPFNLGQPTGTTGFQQGGDGYEIPSNTSAIVPSRNYQTFGRVSYELTPDITAFAQGAYSRSELRFITQANALVPPSQTVTVYRDNPFLPAAIRATLPTAGDFVQVGQYNAGQPQPVARNKTDFWLATGGFTGSLGTLKWQASYTHGDSTLNSRVDGLYDNRALYAATDVVSVNGTPTCRVLTTEFASQFQGCSPMNVFAGNPAAATPAGYDYATGTSRYRAKTKQDSVVASISGSAFELPAGTVDFAVGGEYRKQTLRLVSNADPSLLDTTAERSAYFAGLRNVPAGALFYWLTNVGQARGSLNVKEVFGEVAVPILKDTPFFQELSLNGAVRYTDYSTSGSVTTWKVGGTWKPVDDLLLRANYSRDIRAPNLFELFSGPQSGIGIVNDARSASGAYGSGQNLNVASVTSGNRDLDPEVAKTLTIGGVFSPSFLPGFSVSVDYYRIKVDDLIEQLTAQEILTACLNAGGTGSPECAQIDRTSPTAFPSLVRIQPANIAFLKTAGLDIDANYRTRVGEGALSVRLYANYLDKFVAQRFAGAPLSNYTGVSVVGSNPAGFPRWRGNLTLDYSTDNFGITLSEQYIHKMRLDIPPGIANPLLASGGVVPVLPAAFVDDSVKAFWYTDLSVRFTVPHGKGNMELFGTVNNLFDKDPPLIPGTIPGVNIPTNIAVYDFIGRAFTAGVRFRF
ncbi:TonB-dependent receptor domain-containing protein [Sphingomonas jatrophae]|uniref:TonB-dependent Receptor Plug Domain n=1 Tax=Sphingomonas jatrophae TaxID=1166337 RepID=A0A1I6KCP7_9SPHN|nr:TonB-dependent receptor [Sphingomonas jatrophae]SFR88987.1 TonB-dependent Receptor Plug Domain [Sphingomonas jatrophae]